MKKLTIFAGLLTVLVAVSVSTAKAESAGWTLNLERSEFSAEQSISASRSLAEKAHLMLVSTGVAPRGREGQLALHDGHLAYQADFRFSARLDGRDYPLEGLPRGDSIAIAVHDDDAVVSTIKSSGNKVASFKRTQGNDARTMVITARYFDDNGRVSASERLIFERR